MTKPAPTPRPSDSQPTQTHVGTEQSDDRDEQLAQVVNDLIDVLQAGGEPDVEAAARRRPELADELRSLWGAMLLTHRLADATSGLDVAAAEPHAAANSPAGVALRNAKRESSNRDDERLPRMFGEYELLAELGRGGMGIVYQARQPRLDRITAIKMLRPGAAANSAETVRFRQEAISAARLDHPHVVPVYEVGEAEGRPYFSMQYVAGTTLAERLATGPMPAREAAAILLPICEAVHAAHVQGVLHRDLKPSNILIDQDGRPLVTDFGLAKRIEDDSSLTHTGAILGTPTYMAPEQAAGSRGRIGPTSDVYSLGAILYQMLTGRPPLQGASAMETVLLVLEQEPLPPRLLNPRADASLEMMALRCLQKPPDLRYPSAKALADDLRAFLADEPIAARSGRFGHVVARWLSETHHAVVLENWGLLWMWHSAVLLLICAVTDTMRWQQITSPLPYAAIWVAAMGAWALIFWTLRRRSGPVTFIERQIAHIWAGSVITIALLFPIELLLGLPTLSLSPVLGLVSGCVFLVKAGMLSGRFYVQAVALFATAPAMALLARYDIPFGISLFGLVSAASFFFPGLKYYRQARQLLP